MMKYEFSKECEAIRVKMSDFFQSVWKIVADLNIYICKKCLFCNYIKKSNFLSLVNKTERVDKLGKITFLVEKKIENK